jgi:hypothetical protein
MAERRSTYDEVELVDSQPVASEPMMETNNLLQQYTSNSEVGARRPRKENIHGCSTQKWEMLLRYGRKALVHFEKLNGLEAVAKWGAR